MAVPLPVVRYFILCDQVVVDPTNSHRMSLHGPVSVIRPASGSYPLRLEQLCVLCQWTESRADHRFRLTIEEPQGHTVYRSLERVLPTSGDPLAIHNMVFRVRELVFPRAGLYEVE